MPRAVDNLIQLVQVGDILALYGVSTCLFIYYLLSSHFPMTHSLLHFP